MYLEEDKFKILDYLSNIIGSENFLFDPFIYENNDKYISLNKTIMNFDFKSIFSNNHYCVKNNVYNVPWKPKIPEWVKDVNNFQHYEPFELYDEQIASTEGLINVLWHLDREVCELNTIILIKADSNIFYRFYCVNILK
jgi:hypothetical protein